MLIIGGRVPLLYEMLRIKLIYIAFYPNTKVVLTFYDYEVSRMGCRCTQSETKEKQNY